MLVWQLRLLLSTEQPREIILECPPLKCCGNVSLSEVISVKAGLLGGGPKMMVLVAASFTFGAACAVSRTSATHWVTSLLLCWDLAQSPLARCRHSHSASSVTFMFARSVGVEATISFHPGKCVGVTLSSPRVLLNWMDGLEQKMRQAWTTQHFSQITCPELYSITDYSLGIFVIPKPCSCYVFPMFFARKF